MSLGKLRMKLLSKQKSWFNIYVMIVLKLLEQFRNEEFFCEYIVRFIGNVIGVVVSDTDILVTYFIFSFNIAVLSKIIVKFIRTEVRDYFYSNRKNLARKQIKDIFGFRFDGCGYVYIFELFTSSRKKFFGEINKIKKLRKWKFIWMYNGRIFFCEVENIRIYVFDIKEDFVEFCRR